MEVSSELIWLLESICDLYACIGICVRFREFDEFLNKQISRGTKGADIGYLELLHSKQLLCMLCVLSEPDIDGFKGIQHDDTVRTAPAAFSNHNHLVTRGYALNHTFWDVCTRSLNRHHSDVLTG